MKIQDILFVIVFLIILSKQNPRLAATAGILCFAFSIPLFAFWIFFTAQHLTWYAAALFLLSIVFYLLKERSKVH